MNEKPPPLVSIVITSYNRANYIFKAIESALAQDYPNLEIIISDNDSQDNTDEVVAKYLPDSRITYSKNDTNIGMHRNFKKATEELASGEYITYISSDDYLCDNKFVSDAISLALENPDVLLVFGKLRQVSKKNELIAQTEERPFWLKEFIAGKEVFLGYSQNSWLSFGGCVHRRKELIDMKPFDSYHMAKDIEVNLRLLLQGNACFINRFCYEQVIHFKNESLSIDTEKRIEIVRDCFEELYSYAVAAYPSDKLLFDQWKDDLLTIYFKQTLITLKITDGKEFKNLLQFVKEHYADIYKKISKDLRWKLLNTLYHPIMFPLLRVLSPKRYEYFQIRANTLS